LTGPVLSRNLRFAPAPADDYLLKPFDAGVVFGSLRRALRKKKLDREVQEYRLHPEEMVSERTLQLRAALQQTEYSYEVTLEVVGGAIDLRDSPTAGHSRHVFRYSMELAKSIGVLDAMTSDRVYRAALPLRAAGGVIERGSGILFDPQIQNFRDHSLGQRSTTTFLSV
jgi:HD-GYP domain-containing protein (c-di-GMP phosphodiesterase class II)